MTVTAQKGSVIMRLMSNNQKIPNTKMQIQKAVEKKLATKDNKSRASGRSENERSPQMTKTK